MAQHKIHINCVIIVAELSWDLWAGLHGPLTTLHVISQLDWLDWAVFYVSTNTV